MVKKNINLASLKIKNDEQVISLLDLFVVVAKNINIIFFSAIIIFLITIINLQYFTDSYYKSSSKIMSSSNRGKSNISGIASQFGLDLSQNDSEPKWAYKEIIKSRTIAKKILNRKFSSEKYGNEKPLLQILTHNDEPQPYGLDTLYILAGEIFSDMITVSEDLKNGIVSINVDAQDPILSMDINQALIDELDSHLKVYNKAKTNKTKLFIIDRIKDTEQELIKAEENLKTFKDRNRRIQNSPALQLEQRRLDREVVVLTSVFTTLKQQLENTKIEEVKESDYVIIIDYPEQPLYPFKPNKRLTAFISLILGIGFGIVVAYVIEYLKMSSKEELEKINQIKLHLNKNFSFIKSINPLNKNNI